MVVLRWSIYDDILNFSDMNFSELPEKLVDIDEIPYDIWNIVVDKHASYGA